MSGYVYIAATVALNTFGQLAVKWRVERVEGPPPGGRNKLAFVLRLMLDPWVIASFAATLLAALTWMAALTQFDLSVAYPFQAAGFVLVLLLSAPLLGEPITRAKVVCVILIVGGLIVGSQA